MRAKVPANACRILLVFKKWSKKFSRYFRVRQTVDRVAHRVMRVGKIDCKRHRLFQRIQCKQYFHFN